MRYTQGMRPQLAYGWADTSSVIKKDVLREIIWKSSTLLSTGTKLAPTVVYDVLDVQFEYPSELTGAYPVAFGGIVKVEKVTWAAFNMELQQGQIRWAITDRAIIRQLGDQQKRATTRRAAEAMALQKDDNILDTLEAGVYGTTVTAGDEWDANSGDTDIEFDVLKARAIVLKNSRINETQLNGANLLVYADVYPFLEKLVLIGNTNRSLISYFGGTFGMAVYPTRHSSIDGYAYLIYNDEDTSIHGVLSNRPDVPMVEDKRQRLVGWDYAVRQFWNTKVVPYDSSDSTSHIIIQITGV
jgi:hypothetical protein